MEKMKKFLSFGEQLQAAAKAADVKVYDPRLKQAAATGLGESVGSDGGYLVQEDFSEQLMARTYNQGVLLNRARHETVKGVSVNMPVVHETSRADGSRFGGLQTFWGEEGNAFTPTKTRIGSQSMKLNKLTGFCWATEELFEDASMFGPFIEEAFALEMGFQMEDEMVNGDGAGKFKGVLNSNALITVAKETNQSAKTIVADNVIKMWSRCWGASRRNAVWLINQDIEPQLLKLNITVGTGAIPFYQPSTGPIVEGYPSMFTRPVIPVEYCPTLGTVGDIILADFSQYIIPERELKKALSFDARLINHEVGYRFVLRVNGQPTWNEALTPKNGTATLSPYVALATRN